MFITCACCTYKRPHTLPDAINSFLLQDYPKHKRYLVILDDAGQYDNQKGENWKLVSTNKRYPTLGDKRNACIELSPLQTEVIAVWDDDDIYLPWHLESISKFISKYTPFVRPQYILETNPLGGLYVKYIGDSYHASWAFTKDLFNRVGGYKSINCSEDVILRRSFEEHGVKTTLIKTYPPSFIHGWFREGVYHISGYSYDGYKRLGEIKVKKFDGKIIPRWSRDWLKLAEIALQRNNKMW